MKDIHEIKVVFDADYYKEVRKSKGIKQYKLALKCGIDITYLSQLAQGRILNPSVNTVYRIAIALDVPMEDLLKEI